METIPVNCRCLPIEERHCFVGCQKEAPECVCRSRYPYTHHGPAIHGSKLADYMLSEHSLREDHPELFG